MENVMPFHEPKSESFFKEISLIFHQEPLFIEALQDMLNDESRSDCFHKNVTELLSCVIR